MSKKVEESMSTTLRNGRYKKDPSWNSRDFRKILEKYNIWNLKYGKLKTAKN